MKTWALRFVFTALIAIGLSLTAVAQTAPGVIKAGKVQGEVFRLTADGQSIRLKSGDTLIETDVVQTNKNSQVVLVFMNGSSVKLGADSKLKIEEFKMDPLGEDIAVAKLEGEPSKSKTSLDLAYGEMIGDVKKLNSESSYKINTPVGAAGIRGTQYRIVFRPSGDGRTFTFQLSTAEGRVVFEGTAAAPANVSVPANEEIVVTAQATVDPQSGAVTVVNVEVPKQTTTISADAKASITTAVTTIIVEAVQSTTITTNEQQNSANTNTNSGSGSSNNQNTSNNSNDSNNSTPADNSTPTNNSSNPPNPPATNPGLPTSRAPQTTPGAGG